MIPLESRSQSDLMRGRHGMAVWLTTFKKNDTMSITDPESITIKDG